MSKSSGRPQVVSAIIGGLFLVVSTFISGFFLLETQKLAQQISPTQTAIAATVTAIARTPSQSRLPENYDVGVNSIDYPFPVTSIQINQGDEIEIRVLEANSTLISCVGSDKRTSAIGMIEDQSQKLTLFPKANFCSLIGKIGDGPYFVIGAYYKTGSEVSGKLSLGINDIPPNSCPVLPKEMCFKDNEGKLSVRVTIQRK